MTHMQLALDVRIVDDRISEIAVSGEFSALAERALMDAYMRACAPTMPGADAYETATRALTAIILDFTQMEYMNSGGIGLLVTLLIRMNRQRQRLLAYGLSEHYQQIFAITRLDEAIAIFDTEREALAVAERA